MNPIGPDAVRPHPLLCLARRWHLHAAHLLACWLCLLFLAGPVPGQEPSAVSEVPLIGTLYDFKRDARCENLNMNAGEYDHAIAEFLAKGWDERVLNRYCRLGQTFSATHFYIPMIGDAAAPQEFGIGDKIRDGYWVIHYKGQIHPPADGRYRFLGYAHATLFVAINGKLVLNGCKWDIDKIVPDFPLRSGKPAGAPAGDGRLTVGPWMDLKASDTLDIDVLMGNRVFSVLCVFLLVEKEGETYPLDAAGKFPILPLFQLSPFHGALPQGDLGTRCTLNNMFWKSVQ